MKKLYCIIFIIISILCLTACENNNESKNFTQTFSEYKDKFNKSVKNDSKDYINYIKPSMILKVAPDILKEGHTNNDKITNRFRWENCTNENVSISLKLYYEPGDYDDFVVCANPLLDLSDQTFNLKPGEGVNYTVVRGMLKKYNEYSKEELEFIKDNSNTVYCELSVNGEHYFFRM